jgi:hypothetical protein
MSDVDDDTLDHQGMAIELIDAFAEHEGLEDQRSGKSR